MADAPRPLRVAFLGTPDAAVPALEALLADPDVAVVVVVTAPDRPRGRRGTPTPTPVRAVAERAGLPVLTPSRAAELVGPLTALDLDAAAVVAYGALLPPAVLAACGTGAVNLHFSVLPRWRGASPVQRAIAAGDATTGVSAFVIDDGMDTGALLATAEVAIGPTETAGELTDRLARLGAGVLVRAVKDLVAGAVPTPQPTTGVTLAPKLTAADAVLRLEAPAGTVVDQVRSLAPRPAAACVLRGRRLKVLAAEAVDDLRDPVGPAAPPGTIVAVDARGIVVACGRGAVRLTAVVPEGRAAMGGGAFARGARPEVGERVEAPPV